jgi:hypothetical protein
MLPGPRPLRQATMTPPGPPVVTPLPHPFMVSVWPSARAVYGTLNVGAAWSFFGAVLAFESAMSRANLVLIATGH